MGKGHLPEHQPPSLSALQRGCCLAGQGFSESCSARSQALHCWFPSQRAGQAMCGPSGLEQGVLRPLRKEGMWALWGLAAPGGQELWVLIGA